MRRGCPLRASADRQPTPGFTAELGRGSSDFLLAVGGQAQRRIRCRAAGRVGERPCGLGRRGSSCAPGLGVHGRCRWSSASMKWKANAKRILPPILAIAICVLTACNWALRAPGPRPALVARSMAARGSAERARLTSRMGRPISASSTVMRSSFIPALKVPKNPLDLACSAGARRSPTDWPVQRREVKPPVGVAPRRRTAAARAARGPLFTPPGWA